MRDCKKREPAGLHQARKWKVEESHKDEKKNESLSPNKDEIRIAAPLPNGNIGEKFYKRPL
jgi:hypothetical protein